MPSDQNPLLPKCRDDEGYTVQVFKNPGIWDQRKKDQVLCLAQSLSVDETEGAYSEVSSIPDIWARPLLFDMALFDPNHPLHKQVLGEWRGLLAVFALRDLLNLTAVSIQRVKIPASDANTVRQVTLGFTEALARLIPKKVVANDTGWNDLYVILWNGKPIGMTSPTTLVCTAANYIDRISQLDWFNGRQLVDPTRHLSP